MIWAIIQARMGASRFPGKVLADIAGIPLLNRVLYATLKAGDRDWRYVIATTREPEDNALETWYTGLPAEIRRLVVMHRGSAEPLRRFFEVTDLAESDDIVMRVTADDPCKVPVLMRAAVEGCGMFGVCDTNHGDFTGFGAEAFRVGVLRAVDRDDPASREHVTVHMEPRTTPQVTVTIDRPEDVGRWARFA